MFKDVFKVLQCFILKGRVRLPCEVCSLLGCRTHTEASGTPSLPVVGETQGNGKPDKEVNLEASNDSPPVTTVGLGPGCRDSSVGDLLACGNEDPISSPETRFKGAGYSGTHL